MESFEQNDNIVDLDNLINDFSRLSDVTFVENGLRPEIFPEYSNRLSALSCYVAEKIRPDLNLQKIDEYALIDGFLKTSNIEGKTDEEPGYDDAFGIVVIKTVDEFGFDKDEAVIKIKSYENQENIEARYVKAMREILVLMAHIEDHGKNMRQVVSSKGLFQAGLRKRYDEQTPILDKYLYDLPEIMKFRADLIDRLMLIVFSDTSDQKN